MFLLVGWFKAWRKASRGLKRFHLTETWKVFNSGLFMAIVGQVCLKDVGNGLLAGLIIGPPMTWEFGNLNHIYLFNFVYIYMYIYIYSFFSPVAHHSTPSHEILPENAQGLTTGDFQEIQAKQLFSHRMGIMYFPCKTGDCPHKVQVNMALFTMCRFFLGILCG